MVNLTKEQLQIDIENAFSKVINVYSRPFSEYSKFYLGTTENLMGLFDQIDTSSYNSALSVLSSGDHVFNMVCKGISKIDTFDSNRLTEYFALGIKKTAIECLSYSQFFDFFDDYESVSKRNDCFNFILSNAPQRYKEFWEELSYLCRDSYGSLYLLPMLSQNSRGESNCYDRDKKSFQETKEKLRDAQISFKYCNIKNIPSEFGSYDFIGLSNILNYYKNIFQNNKLKTLLFGKNLARNELIAEKAKLIKKIFNNNLNENGEMLYEYFYILGDINLLDGPERTVNIDAINVNDPDYYMKKFNNYNLIKYAVREGLVLSLKK